MSRGTRWDVARLGQKGAMQPAGSEMLIPVNWLGCWGGQSLFSADSGVGASRRKLNWRSIITSEIDVCRWCVLRSCHKGNTVKWNWANAIKLIYVHKVLTARRKISKLNLFNASLPVCAVHCAYAQCLINAKPLTDFHITAVITAIRLMQMFLAASGGMGRGSLFDIYIIRKHENMRID